MNILSMPRSAGTLRPWLPTLGESLERRAALAPNVHAPRPLARGATCWITSPLGSCIRCAQGTLWVTVDGCLKDIVLEVGESYTADRASPLSIHALSDSQYLLY